MLMEHDLPDEVLRATTVNCCGWPAQTGEDGAALLNARMPTQAARAGAFKPACCLLANTGMAFGRIEARCWMAWSNAL